ncbi:hypothetical protein [Neolewinella litorea]|uniref:Uncharacterized protein n=1 Tax=Neolewinella litorea TaxID=2562452 RepID=A0A4S4NNA6_9BACT|nr:hypothetical protein [Neolewinella litorea]THH41454.1 hypothetical protein E4021_02320 [Neolewinella litorea]
MIGRTLARFGRRMGWYRGPDGVFGLYRGYLVSIQQQLSFGVPRKETIRVETQPLTPEQQVDISKTLADTPLPMRFARPEVTGSTLCLHYRRLFTAHDRHEVRKVIDAIIDVAEAYGLDPAVPADPDNGGLHFCLYRGKVMVLDNAAFKRLRDNHRDRCGNHLPPSSSYVYGVAGGSLYALVGVVPTVLAAYLMEPLPVVGGIGVSYLCYYGYRQFNGAVGSRTTPAMLVLSLLWILVTTYGSFWVQLLGEGRNWSEAWWYTSDLRQRYIYDGGLAIITGVLASITLSRYYLRSAGRFREARPL